MATLNANALTLLDFAKRLDPNTDSVTSVIAELLNETNEVLTDMLWKEGNLPTGHRLTMRTGLPASTWRKLNQGVAATKSTTVQVDESTGMLEQLGQIDKALADLNGNTAAFRLSENVAHMEAMNIDMATTLFYGDTSSNPERFLGLAPRYNTVSTASAANAQNVIDGGGTGGDNTSVWLVCWGERAVHGIFPKGSKMGLQHTAKSEAEWLFDSDQNRYLGYLDHYRWDCGLALPDWRYVVRIANIDVSNLVAESSAADLVKLMIRALRRVPSLKGVKPVFYTNRTVRTMLDIQALNKQQNVLSIKEAVGSVETNFLGVPIRTCDVLLNTEARIV